MVEKLDSVQPVYILPPTDQIPDGDEDKPVAGLALTTTQGPLKLPALVFGAASISTQYNSEAVLASNAPFRTVRLALRYGITAIDTSAFYHVSEIVLGVILKSLEPEYPRSSYQLMTKCGRYGRTAQDFDYSPATVRASVQRSLQRLNTTYLDTVYVHDVEFVVENKRPRTDGNPLGALGPEKDAYGLAEGQEGTILSDGDRQLLGAVAELRKMKTEGLIRTVGISGYPLPTLMRLALLVLHSTGEPLDVLLSYSHLNLQNATLIPFAQALRERARVGQILAASPWSMGLLTPSPPPPWHPAPPALTEVTRVGLRLHADFAGGLPNVALGYAYRIAGEHDLPFVAGFSSLAEVHASVKGWREIQGVEDPERIRREQEARKLFEDAGYLDWSWTSPV